MSSRPAAAVEEPPGFPTFSSAALAYSAKQPRSRFQLFQARRNSTFDNLHFG
jgi:hypothetical protein